jgi:hypothetical protein
MAGVGCPIRTSLEKFGMCFRGHDLNQIRTTDALGFLRVSACADSSSNQRKLRQCAVISRSRSAPECVKTWF